MEQEHDMKARSEGTCQKEITELLWYEYIKGPVDGGGGVTAGERKKRSSIHQTMKAGKQEHCISFIEIFSSYAAGGNPMCLHVTSLPDLESVLTASHFLIAAEGEVRISRKPRLWKRIV